MCQLSLTCRSSLLAGDDHAVSHLRVVVGDGLPHGNKALDGAAHGSAHALHRRAPRRCLAAGCHQAADLSPTNGFDHLYENVRVVFLGISYSYEVDAYNRFIIRKLSTSQ